MKERMEIYEARKNKQHLDQVTGSRMKRKENKESNCVKFDISIGKRCRGLYITKLKSKAAKQI